MEFLSLCCLSVYKMNKLDAHSLPLAFCIIRNQEENEFKKIVLHISAKLYLIRIIGRLNQQINVICDTLNLIQKITLTICMKQENISVSRCSQDS